MWQIIETSKKDIKLERVIIPAAVDSTQQEALKLLRSLKVCLLRDILDIIDAEVH